MKSADAMQPEVTRLAGVPRSLAATKSPSMSRGGRPLVQIPD
jgi:hypothetical protein